MIPKWQNSQFPCNRWIGPLFLLRGTMATQPVNNNTSIRIEYLHFPIGKKTQSTYERLATKTTTKIFTINKSSLVLKNSLLSPSPFPKLPCLSLAPEYWVTGSQLFQNVRHTHELRTVGVCFILCFGAMPWRCLSGEEKQSPQHKGAQAITQAIKKKQTNRTPPKNGCFGECRCEGKRLLKS